MEADLWSKIHNITTSRTDRDRAAAIVLNSPESFNELTSLAFSRHKEKERTAFRVMELVCVQSPELLDGHLDVFISGISALTASESRRPAAKICAIIAGHPDLKNSLKKEEQEKLAEVNFDWLIGKEKVAVKVFAMECLFQLRDELPWIREALKPVLEQGIPAHTAAYLARARHILDKL
ncbi:hypothetical protein [Robertkochia solimangrovi]|uniref:hypothetical protein n=1 Tax=Robertkochia solimangrovi TaxID=2213046 RepID=UPI00117C0BC3|nr:hypothetical protein [Robertkochia solimangrovi]TRZ43646.1 hypothetical protein DMZ48_09530 [Robertkochia solimangrovi]